MVLSEVQNTGTYHVKQLRAGGDLYRHLQDMGFLPGEQVKVVSHFGGNVIVNIKSTRVELSDENKKQFYIPQGFAHGFLVLSDVAEFTYKCTDFYHPGDEGGVIWNDPDINIQWPLEEGVDLIISEKDQKWLGLKDTFKF